MSSHTFKQANLTGESVTVKGKTIYRLLCPECEGPQWNSQGRTTCIYCDAPYSVNTFKVIPGNRPEEDFSIKQ